MNHIILKVEALTKIYQMGEYEVPALQDISFEVQRGSLCAIYGESGSGKSTLLHILGSLETPTRGQIWLDGQPCLTPQGLPRFSVETFRAQTIGFVFQHNNLLSDLNALENVVIPGLILGKKMKEVVPRARELLHDLGLSKRLNHYPSQLSGGEQQRVAIARALLNDPKLLLADEPTGNLDSKTSDSIYEMLDNLRKSKGTTMIVVTHSLRLVERATQTLQLKDGRMIHEC